MRKLKIGVTLRLPEGKSAGRVPLISPDEDRETTLLAAPGAGSVESTVPRLKTYAVAVVSLK